MANAKEKNKEKIVRWKESHCLELQTHLKWQDHAAQGPNFGTFISSSKNQTWASEHDPHEEYSPHEICTVWKCCALFQLVQMSMECDGLGLAEMVLVDGYHRDRFQYKACRRGCRAELWHAPRHIGECPKFLCEEKRKENERCIPVPPHMSMIHKKPMLIILHRNKNDSLQVNKQGCEYLANANLLTKK